MATKKHSARREIWKPIKGWEFYEVSDQGRVRSLPRRVWAGDRWRRVGGRVLKSPGTPYPRVSLRANGKTTGFNVHALVLTAFVGPCPPGKECRHMNGIGGDIRLANLAWGTPKENSADKIIHGTGAQGSRNGSAKLTEAIVMNIRRRHASGAATSTLATRFSLAKRRVIEICSGRSWRHIPYGASVTP